MTRWTGFGLPLVLSFFTYSFFFVSYTEYKDILEVGRMRKSKPPFAHKTFFFSPLL